MHGKRIVVTGGAGFIGSNLAEALCEENDVAVLDDLSTGRIENISHLVKSKKIEFVKGSITDFKLMNRVMKGADYVFHEAAIVSVPYSVSNPRVTAEVNISGTLNLLTLARDCGVKKAVFASSCAVYGDLPGLPKREEMPTMPLSPYALTKLAGEHYCRLFTELYGLKTVSLRYFNVFGPKQDPKSEYAAVIPRFITSALSGKPLTIHGNGEQTRDFTFVKDVVRANLLAAESDAKGAFNIAGGKRISVNDMAKAVLKITGSKSQIGYDSARTGDVKHSLADTTKAKEAFGWMPKYALEWGLKETAEFFGKPK